jgi:hypothetical protein
MKRKVSWRRRRASMPSSGMSLANQSSWVSLKTQLTGTALRSFLDLRGLSFPTLFQTLSLIVCFGQKKTDLIACLSTKSDGKLASLDEYISRMKPGQKDIFYITGSSKEQLEKSPFLERLTKKNYEVCC